MIKYTVIIVVIVCLFLCTTYCLYKCFKPTATNHVSYKRKQKPYLWVYWQLKDGVVKPPDYITLCIKTMKMNSTLFNLVQLDDKNIYDYLPNLRTDINELPIALKTDYIRVMLLYKYGGLWLDADTIMMTDMRKVVDLLYKNEDFIGFGCTGPTCTNGYGVPSNGAMAAKKNSVLMKYCLDKLNEKLDKIFEDNDSDSDTDNNDNNDNDTDTNSDDNTTNTTTSSNTSSNTENTKVFKDLGYYDLGKLIIWNGIKYLEKKQNYKYYHFPSYVDGTRDKNGHWIAKELIKPIHIDLLDESKLMMVFLVNSTICGSDPEYNWFCKLNENQILNGNYFVTHLFKKALKL